MLASCVAVAALGASAAPATGSVTGPFDSAHQPKTIRNPDIAAPDPTDPDGFTIGIGFSVGCPSGVATPLTVTFSDPTGAITDTLRDPCSGTWSGDGSNLGSKTSDLSTVQQDGCPPATCGGQSQELLADDEFEPAWDSGRHPFLYQVSSPEGVLSQGALTGTVDDDGNIVFSNGWPPPQPPVLSITAARSRALGAVRAKLHRPDVGLSERCGRISRSVVTCQVLAITRRGVWGATAVISTHQSSERVSSQITLHKEVVYVANEVCMQHHVRPARIFIALRGRQFLRYGPYL